VGLLGRKLAAFGIQVLDGLRQFDGARLLAHRVTWMVGLGGMESKYWLQERVCM